MSRKLSYILVLAPFLAAICAKGPAMAMETYYVVSDDSSYGGLSADKFLEMATEIMRVAGKKLGVDFNVSLLKGEQALYDAVKEGKAHIIISGMDYPRALDFGVPVEPWTALEIGGKVGYEDCIWIAADSDIKTVDDLKGKTIMGLPAVSLRKILFDNGYDMPFDQFFSEFKMYRNPVKALEAVLYGEADSVFMGTNYMGFLMFDEKFKKGLKPVECSDTMYPTQFLIAKGFDPEFRQKMDLMITNAHRDPDFNAVKFVFLTLSAKMVIVDHDDFKTNIEMYNLSKERGWREELEPLIQQLAEIEE